FFFFFFSSRRRHTRFSRDWSSDVCSSDLIQNLVDEIEEMPSALENVADALALVGAQRVHLHQLGKPKDGIQRGPQFVAHPGEEFALGPVRHELRTPLNRSEEHTSELQSRENLVCRLLLEKKKRR